MKKFELFVGEADLTVDRKGQDVILTVRGERIVLTERQASDAASGLLQSALEVIATRPKPKGTFITSAYNFSSGTNAGWPAGRL